MHIFLKIDQIEKIIFFVSFIENLRLDRKNVYTKMNFSADDS